MSQNNNGGKSGKGARAKEVPIVPLFASFMELLPELKGIVLIIAPLPTGVMLGLTCKELFALPERPRPTKEALAIELVLLNGWRKRPGGGAWRCLDYLIKEKGAQWSMLSEETIRLINPIDQHSNCPRGLCHARLEKLLARGFPLPTNYDEMLTLCSPSLLSRFFQSGWRPSPETVANYLDHHYFDIELEQSKISMLVEAGVAFSPNHLRHLIDRKAPTALLELLLLKKKFSTDNSCYPFEGRFSRITLGFYKTLRRLGIPLDPGCVLRAFTNNVPLSVIHELIDVEKPPLPAFTDADWLLMFKRVPHQGVLERLALLKTRSTAKPPSELYVQSLDFSGHKIIFDLLDVLLAYPCTLPSSTPRFWVDVYYVGSHPRRDGSLCEKAAKWFVAHGIKLADPEPALALARAENKAEFTVDILFTPFLQSACQLSQEEHS